MSVVLSALLVAFCAWSVGAATGDEFLGRRVTQVDVVIEGAEASATTEMKVVLEVAVGQSYSPVNIRDSLVKLYRSGLVSEARVEATAAGADGVALRFVVKPQARIDTIVFEGEPIFSAGELRSRLSEIDTGTRLSVSAVNRGLADLISYYSARGFNDARITADIRIDATGTRATVAYTVAAGERARVAKYDLNITGAHIDLSQINHAISEGDLYSQIAVGLEMERLREAYLSQNYLTVRVSNRVLPAADNRTVNIILDLESGPRVEIDVQGLEITAEEKREILPFYRQGGVDEFTIEEGRLRLLDFAQRDGYFFAEVTSPGVPATPDDLSRLIYTVEPGRKYRLSEINFEGLAAVSPLDLSEDLKSKTASFIPFFGFGRGITSNDILRQDVNTLSKRLKELGYRRAVVEERRGVSLEGDRLIITFAVTEGPRTFVEEIGMRGNTIFTADELMERLKEIKPGDALVADVVRGAADRLISAYNSRGYSTAEVNPEIVELSRVGEQDRVRLIYNITEGNRVRIREIQTRGTAMTSVSRLEKDFYRFRVGDYLDSEKVVQTERDMYDTNAFSSVSITSEPTGQTADGVEERRVMVNIVEAKPNLLIYGFGFQFSKDPLTIPGLSFLNGVRGNAQITNSNLFGKLYVGSIQMRVGRDELLGQASFQNPRMFGTNFPTLISIFARRLAEKTFRSDRYTALIQTERRLSEDTIVYASYNFERISLFDLQVSEEEIDRNRQAIRLGRIGPSFIRDKRDNAFDPTRGTATIGSFYLASKFLGGNEQFTRFLIEHSRYYPVPKLRDTIYSISGRLGLSTPFGGRQTLPISERFFAGGARDLRGFGFEEAGPVDPVTGRPVGGNAVVVVNNEVGFPLFGIVGGTAFSDIGNVFRRVRDISPGGMTVTFGLGLRIKTPLGPVRLDVGALVINKPANAPNARGHFSYGQTF